MLKTPTLTLRFASVLISAGLLSITSAQAGLAQGDPASEQTDLPAAAEVIAAHIEASGGEEAMRANTSAHAVGKFEMAAAGISAELSMFAAAPNKFYMKLDIPGMGVVEQGFDGKVGWSIDPNMGASLLEGGQLDDMKRQADFYTDLNIARNHKSMETVAVIEFNGTKCYDVKLIDHQDKETHMYFDVAKHLKVGESGEADMGGMMVNTTSVFAEFKEVGGVLIPMSVIVDIPDIGIEQVITVETVTNNEVDQSIFELPADIKALFDDDE